MGDPKDEMQPELHKDASGTPETSNPKRNIWLPH